MSFNQNTKTLNQQFEGLSLKSESKYDEDTLDEAIVNGLKGEYRDFCKSIEQFLNQFMKGPKTNEVIPDLNKYQRKIVHKICDLYCITRDYVDVKSDESGSITITKQDKSFIPSTTLEERYQKYSGKSKKTESGKSGNPFANKKVIIKSRAAAQPDLKTPSDKSEKSSVSATEGGAQGGNIEDTHLEIEHKKKKNYEEARDRIMQGNDEPDDQNAQGMKQKKGKRYEKGYDPEFDRSRGQSDMGMFMNPNMMNMGPMNPVPGLGMPGMHGMNPVPGMSYYPPYMQPQFYPGPGHAYPNPNYGGGGGNPNYIMPFPGSQNQNQGQNQNQNQNQNQGFQNTGGQSNGYYQNFPGLDKNPSKK